MEACHHEMQGQERGTYINLTSNVILEDRLHWPEDKNSNRLPVATFSSRILAQYFTAKQRCLPNLRAVNVTK